MIQVHLYKNKNEDIYAFKVSDHAQSLVCAAVSILALNAVNSIEALTTATSPDFFYKHDDTGYLACEVTSNKETSQNKDVALLLNSFALGIYGIKDSHPKEITIIEF